MRSLASNLGWRRRPRLGTLLVKSAQSSGLNALVDPFLQLTESHIVMRVLFFWWLFLISIGIGSHPVSRSHHVNRLSVRLSQLIHVAKVFVFSWTFYLASAISGLWPLFWGLFGDTGLKDKWVFDDDSTHLRTFELRICSDHLERRTWHLHLHECSLVGVLIQTLDRDSIDSGFVLPPAGVGGIHALNALDGCFACPLLFVDSCLVGQLVRLRDSLSILTLYLLWNCAPRRVHDCLNRWSVLGRGIAVYVLRTENCSWLFVATLLIWIQAW